MSNQINHVSVTVVITKIDKTKNGDNYATVDAAHGGNFNFFPKKADDKGFTQQKNAAAQAIIAKFPLHKRITVNNVAISNGAVLVYDDTFVTTEQS